ncbi:MAG: stalk domain-containing protein [Fimbriimonadales bacterium]|nr:stalk domain-containing protein [Fimbriimonadales bacterium]
MDKRIWSLLALAGLTTTGIAAWQPQKSPLQILKREPNRLTMQFRGVKPATVEVLVDGVVVATRHLSGQTDRLQLNLQSAGLAPGSHEAVIKLYDAQGRLISQSNARIELLPDPNSPLSIVVPRHGNTVSGDVPIEARLNRQGAAYVSFFVDGQIRGLRNYPPYVYNWDTTRETNGWHTIEVWSYDGNQTLKTPPMRVYVNNPGGRTERQAVAEQALPEGIAAESEPTLAEPALRPAENAEARLSESARLSAPETPELELAETPEPTVAMETAEPAPAAELSVQAEARLSDARTVAPLEEPNALTVATTPARAPEHLRIAQAEPQMRGQKLRAPQVALAAAPSATRTAAWLSLERGTRLPAGATQFEVALDGMLLSFDVAPQVDDGIALLPIRPLLESLGARLRWDNQAKTATIELGERRIVLRVRENEILADGAPVPADAPLRIHKGRVLVPASALRELLNAEVAFDGTARHLIINLNN